MCPLTAVIVKKIKSIKTTTLEMQICLPISTYPHFICKGSNLSSLWKKKTTKKHPISFFPSYVGRIRKISWECKFGICCMKDVPCVRHSTILRISKWKPQTCFYMLRMCTITFEVGGSNHAILRQTKILRRPTHSSYCLSIKCHEANPFPLSYFSLYLDEI